MKKAKVSFSTDMSVNVTHLQFELKRPNLDYPDHIDGKYYFTLSDKEKRKYRLTNPAYVLKHSDYNRIFNLTVNE
jgi:hypothetical protein